MTPPAYNYLPFYIDQDHYEGNNYAAFKNLGQYVGFRENVLFYHLGVYNEEYFKLVHSRDEIKETSIVTKAAYQRKPFFLYPINKCTCREVSICNYEG